jgi:hypothetical protein
MRTEENHYFSIQIKEFRLEDYSEFSEKIRSGKLLINRKAVGLLCRVFVKVLEQINQDLIVIASEKGRFSQTSVRQFAVSYNYLRYIDMFYFSASVAPKNDIWFQNEDSDDWKLLNEILEVVPL